MGDDNDESVKQIENRNDKPWLWKKGESGNPNGRPPRGWTWADIIEEEMTELLPTKDGTALPIKKAIGKRLAKMAIDGDIQAIKEVMDRMDGRPRQQVEMTGKDGKDLIPTPIYGGKSTE